MKEIYRWCAVAFDGSKKCLKEMDSRPDMLEEMLGMDAGNIIDPAPILLAVHFMQIRSRKQATHQAKKAFKRIRSNFGSSIREGIRIRHGVRGPLRRSLSYCPSIGQGGKPNTVVKLIKMAEIEGKGRREGPQYRFFHFFCGMSEESKPLRTAIRLVEKAAKFRSMQANARIIRCHRFQDDQKLRQFNSSKI